MEQILPVNQISFKCSAHPGYDIIAVIMSEDIFANKRLCCNKCMLYTYRGYSTDQFILLEDILQGNDQATAYFLPISKKEQDILQDAIIQSLDNGYVHEVEDFFTDLQKKINQKINDKRKEAIVLAQEKSRLLDELRESLTQSQTFKELQNLLVNSFQNKLETNLISENIDEFLEKHRKYMNVISNQQQVQPVENNQIQNGENSNPNQNEQQPNEQQPNEQNNQIEVINENVSDLDFKTKFKNFRKKDFTIKANTFEINIVPLYQISVNFVKYNSNTLVLEKNEEGQATIYNNGGQTAICKSDYIIVPDKTQIFTFEFSDKPSDYMRIGISKKAEDPDDKHCQCFGWANNFDLSITKGENLSNKMGPKSQLKMEVNIKQNKLEFYDAEMKNIAQKKPSYTLDEQAQYTIVIYFHSDLKQPITITLLQAELFD